VWDLEAEHQFAPGFTLFFEAFSAEDGVKTISTSAEYQFTRASQWFPRDLPHRGAFEYRADRLQLRVWNGPQLTAPPISRVDRTRPLIEGDAGLDGNAADRFPCRSRPRPVLPMPQANDLVFLLDVDNTLLDNDRIVADLSEHLLAEFGAESRARYWTVFEALRTELGYADYLGALQRYRIQAPQDSALLLPCRRSCSTIHSRSVCTQARCKRSRSSGVSVRRPSSPTVTWFSSRERCSARACGTRSPAAS